jgi:hypothetical protein
MPQDYQIFDDIISKENQSILYDYVKKENLKWEFIQNITGDYGGQKENLKFPANVHPQIYCNDDDIKKIIDEIQLTVAKKMNLEFVQNYRWKINWTQPLNNDYNPMELLHCDRIIEHIAVVYYINDSTGDTFIYNNLNGNNAESYQSNFNKVDFDSHILLKHVSPKMGRCIAFDGRLAHYGDYPESGNRYIINFNFVAKNKNNKKSII